MLYYENSWKYRRAQAAVRAEGGDPEVDHARVRAHYEAMGGKIVEGSGFAPVMEEPAPKAVPKKKLAAKKPVAKKKK